MTVNLTWDKHLNKGKIMQDIFFFNKLIFYDFILKKGRQVHAHDFMTYVYVSNTNYSIL